MEFFPFFRRPYGYDRARFLHNQYTMYKAQNLKEENTNIKNIGTSTDYHVESRAKGEKPVF